jgi:toxin YoeB
MRSPKPPKKPGRPQEAEEEKYRLQLDADFLDDLRYWAATEAKILRRLLDLMEAVHRDPFAGIGKPEPLKAIGPGVWSRRITLEHEFSEVGVRRYALGEGPAGWEVKAVFLPETGPARSSRTSSRGAVTGRGAP